MNSAIQQSQDALQALRDRVQLSTSEMYQMIGREEPVKVFRFIVKPRGENNFDVIERSTGKLVTVRTGHNNATAHARELEAKPDQFNIKHFGRLLRDWVLGISTTLFLFAFFGSHL